jgi:septal ring factor EnvC (AmiA/AmiB activator)
MANKKHKTMDDRVEELQQRIGELELERQQLMHERSEAHQESVQLARQLSDANEWRQRAEKDFRDLQDIQNKSRLLIHYYLYVELGRSGEREDQRQCSQVQRFIYMLQDTLDGKPT